MAVLLFLQTLLSTFAIIANVESRVFALTTRKVPRVLVLWVSNQLGNHDNPDELPPDMALQPMLLSRQTLH